MSEILICGMEMPEHCGECKLKAEYDDETFCPFFADNVEFWIAVGRRHEDCPLGYIPPHGRLIDADELIREHRADNYDYTIYATYLVQNAPSVIQASECKDTMSELQSCVAVLWITQKFDGEWQNWNPKKIWVPSKKGLGMGKVFDMVNEVYEKSFYRYE